MGYHQQKEASSFPSLFFINGGFVMLALFFISLMSRENMQASLRCTIFFYYVLDSMFEVLHYVFYFTSESTSNFYVCSMFVLCSISFFNRIVLCAIVSSSRTIKLLPVNTNGHLITFAYAFI